MGWVKGFQQTKNVVKKCENLCSYFAKLFAKFVEFSALRAQH